MVSSCHGGGGGLCQRTFVRHPDHGPGWPTMACHTIWSAYDEQTGLTRAQSIIKRIDQSVTAAWRVNTLPIRTADGKQ